jgi:hypothetical protein
MYLVYSVFFIKPGLWGPSVYLIVKRSLHDKIQLCFTVFSLIDSYKKSGMSFIKKWSVFYGPENSLCNRVCYDTV